MAVAGRARRPGWAARWLKAGALGLAGLGMLLAAGCGSNKPDPTPLKNIVPEIAGRQVWRAEVGKIEFPLNVATPAGQFVVAGGDGAVMALDADTGAVRWRGSAGAPLSAGVGSDGRFSAVVTEGNELVVLGEQGQPLWRRRLPARVVSAPLVAGERVFVLRVDRVAMAFDAQDGRPLWTFERPGEPLTLAQGGVVAPFGDLLLVGQGPRLAALDPLRGRLRWEVAIATPRGTNEVERLADLVGPLTRAGDIVCARAFQSAVGCVDAARGALVWSRPNAGSQALGGDAELLAGADASGRLAAWHMASGEVAWTQDTLLHRELSGSLLAGRVLIVGDLEGQVHFLDRGDGRTLLRMPTDGSPVVGRPALSGTTVLVVTRKGGLFAFRPA
jgi:outer membrane protein assembly factor BamB